MSDAHYTPKDDAIARLEHGKTEFVSENSKPFPLPSASKKHTPLILRLTRRAVVFLGLLTIALILYYISANMQYFLEVNIKIILWGMTVSSIALALFCAAGVAESLYFTIVQKQSRFLFRLIPYGLVMILAATFAVFSRTVDLLSLGYP